MTTKNFKWTMLAVAAVATAACSKSEVDGGVDSLYNRVTIAAADGTRSALTMDGVFSWKKVDALGVSNSANANEKFAAVDASNSTSEFTPSASFSGELLPTTDAEYAYVVYPYSAEGSFEGGSYTFTLAEQQRQLYTNANSYQAASVADYAYMYGRSTTALESDATTMGVEMQHMMSFLHFDVAVAKMPDFTYIREVKIICDTPELFSFATSATVNFSQDGEPTVTLGEGRCTEIVTDFMANTKPYLDVRKDNAIIRFTTFPQTIPAGAEFTIEFQSVKVNAAEGTITEDSELYRYKKVFTKELPAKAGYFYNIVDLASTVVLDGTSSLETLMTNMPIDKIETLRIAGDYSLTDADFTYILNTLSKGSLRYLDISATQTTAIPDSAFNSTANKIETYILGDVVKEVGYLAFANNTHLTYIDASGVESFTANGTAAEAFKGCTAIESISLPSLKRIEGTGLFTMCSALKSVTFGAEQLEFTQNNAATFNKVATPFTITTYSPSTPIFAAAGKFGMTGVDVTIRYPEAYADAHNKKWTKTGAASVTYESF